jgi:hypothetical protein
MSEKRFDNHWYEIDCFDDSFLKDAQLIDPKTFDFNGDVFKKAVAESLRRQEAIDSIPKFRYPAWK